MPEFIPGAIDAGTAIQERINEMLQGVEVPEAPQVEGEDPGLTLQNRINEMLSGVDPRQLQILNDPRPEVQRMGQQGLFTTPAGVRDRHGEPPDVTALEFVDVFGKSFVAGIASGVIRPMENFPGLGNKIIRPYLSPVMERLNQEAMQTVMQAIADGGQIDPDMDVPGLLKAVQTTGTILGSLVGLIIPFTGLLKLSRFLFAARAAGKAGAAGLSLQPFMADMVGFFGYGAITKEPGLIQSFLTKPGEVRTHQQDFMGDLQERMVTGLFTGGELLGISIAFTTLMRAAKSLKFERATAEGVRTQLTLPEFVAQQIPESGFRPTQKVEQVLELLAGAEAGVTIDKVGGIIVNIPSSPVTAVRRAQIASQNEFILRNPQATKMIAEGALPDEAMIEALRGLPEGRGSFLVMNRIEDPALLRAQVAGGLEVRAQEAVARAVTDDGLSHTASEMARLSEPGAPLFRVYGRGKGTGEVLSGDITNVPGPQGIVEFVVRPSSEAVVERIATWKDLPAESLRSSLKALRSTQKELLVIEQGTRGFQEVIPLQANVVRSARPVEPEAIASASRPALSAEIGLRGDVPMEVRLARRYDDMEFIVRETPGEKGLFDTLAMHKDAPLSERAIQAWERGDIAIPGQTVYYHQAPHELVELSGKTATILSLEGATRKVRTESIVPGATGIPDIPFEVAMADRFFKFLESEVGAVAERSLGRAGLREQALKMERPGAMKRDVSMKGDPVIHPEELGDDIAARVRAEADDLTNGLRAGDKDVFIQEPYPVLGEFDAMFKKFVDTEGLSLSPAEYYTLKGLAARTVRQRLHTELPARDRELFEAMSRETGVAIDKYLIDQPLEGLAALEGFQVNRISGGRIELGRIGTQRAEVFANEETALRVLKEKSIAIQEELHVGMDYLGVSMPGGMNSLMPNFIPEGDLILDRLGATAGETVIRALQTHGIPTATWKSMTRWFSLIDDATGIPFARLSDSYITGKKFAANSAFPFIQRLDKVAKGMKMRDMDRVGEFMRQIEDVTVMVNPATRLAAARKFGLTERQIQYMDETRDTLTSLFPQVQRQYGLAFEEDFILNYFRKQQQAVRSFPSIQEPMGRRQVSSSWEQFKARYKRSGDLPDTELNPTLVAKRYVHAFMHDKHVGAHYEEMARLVNMKVKDLPPGQQKKIQQALGELGGPEAYALPAPIRHPIQEMLAYDRGFPQEGAEKAVMLMQALFKKLGIDVPDKQVREMINIQMGAWYGAAMAGRLRPIVRQGVQNLFNLYPRVGGPAMSRGFKRAGTDEGRREVLEGGGFFLQERGVATGEMIFDKVMSEAPITSAGNPVGALFLRGVMQAGQTAKRISAFGLRGFGGADVENRVVAYLSQVEYTKPLLARFRAKTMTRETFMERGLFAWGSGEKKEFMRLLKTRGDKEALQYIGRQSADLTNYVYRLGAQPLALQSTAGRILGMFGTWPLWQKDLLFANLKNTGLAGKALMAARYATVTGAVTTIGWSWGVNLMSWYAPLSPLSYFGGPASDYAVDIKEAVQAPWAHKPAAFGRLMTEYGRLAFPGQLLFRDIATSLEMQAKQGDLRAAMAAQLFGRPVDGGPHLLLESEQPQGSSPARSPSEILFPR